MSESYSFKIHAYKTTRCIGSLTITEERIINKIEKQDSFFVIYKRRIIICLLLFWMVGPLFLIPLFLYLHVLNTLPACKAANFSVNISEIKSAEPKDRRYIGKCLELRLYSGKKNIFSFLII